MPLGPEAFRTCNCRRLRHRPFDQRRCRHPNLRGLKRLYSLVRVVLYNCQYPALCPSGKNSRWEQSACHSAVGSAKWFLSATDVACVARPRR